MPRNWSVVRTERSTLAEDLTPLTDEQWRTPSLCEGWTVRDVLAHLTAAASLNTAQWLAGVIRCRFDFDRQVAMRLAEQLGSSPHETLDRFRRVITSTKTAAGPFGALLGELVVHAEDIRRPLAIRHEYPNDMLTRAASFYAKYDFTVPSKRAIRGLRLEATDGAFAVGDGPGVSGSTLALVMSMAGRVDYCDDLAGEGVVTLRERLLAGAG